jgi:hypothetical protein
MATLAQLKASIADDTLRRNDCTNQIANAIDSAIRFYNTNRWWFLEGVAETTMSSSQAYYAVPTDFIKHDTLLITISGSKYPLDQIPYNDMDKEDDGRFFGQPTRYSFYQNSIRLYPVPDSGYVMTLSYHKSLDAPSDSASNSWTSDAFDLIRYRAAWDVAKHYLRNPDLANMLKESEMETYMNLNSQNIGKLSIGKISRSDW